GAVRAGDRGIFDQLHRRVRVAHAIAAFRRLADHLPPVALVRRGNLRQRRIDVRRGGGEVAPVTAAASGEEEGKGAGAGCGGETDSHGLLSPIFPTTGMLVTAAVPSRDASPRASDSRQARSSGSATAPGESPRSPGPGTRAGA